MRGMIVAAQPEAAEVGADILRRGGNAVDAAIACAFSQGVVDPQMCGIGGFGAMQICLPGRAPHGVRVDGEGWTGGADPQRDGMAIGV